MDEKLDLEELNKSAEEWMRHWGNSMPAGQSRSMARSMMRVVEKLMYLRDEFQRLHEQEILSHRCEWFVSIAPVATFNWFLDGNTCLKYACCVGELGNRRSQYWLCQEHQAQWSVAHEGGVIVECPTKYSRFVDYINDKSEDDEV